MENENPPHGIGWVTVHPSRQRCLRFDELQASGDAFIRTKYRLYRSDLGMHVPDPHKPVPFNPVPDVVLHIQMYRIRSCIPDTVQQLIAALKAPSVRYILDNQYRFYGF